MQWKDGLNVLPWPIFGYNPCSPFLPWAGNEMMDDTKPFGFVQRFPGQCALSLPCWFGSSHAIEPIFDPSRCQCKSNAYGDRVEYRDL